MFTENRIFLIIATIATLFALTANASNFLQNPYYPTKFKELIDRDKIKNTRLKSSLFNILASYHESERGEDDKIVKSCSRKKKDCYRQRSDYSYKTARKYLFGTIHLQKKRGRHYVKDVYCEQKISTGVGPGKIPDHTKMNCEHTWPQSRFNTKISKGLQKNDLHHLYPVNNRANSSRQNFVFAEVDGRDVHESCEASQKGNAINTSTRAFEPPNEHKGNVARAIFYFSIRYKLKISKLEEKFLKVWNEIDPVDDAERKRNELIYKFQKNRNPFIDNPDLVNLIADF